MGQSPPEVSNASCHGCCIALSSRTIHRGQSPSRSTLRSCKPSARRTTSLNLVRRCNSSSTASRNTGSGWVRSSMWSKSGLIEVLTGPGCSHSPLSSVAARIPLLCIVMFPFHPCRARYTSAGRTSHTKRSLKVCTIIYNPRGARQSQLSCHCPALHQRQRPCNEERCSPQDIKVEPGVAEKRHPQFFIHQQGDGTGHQKEAEGMHTHRGEYECRGGRCCLRPQRRHQAGMRRVGRRPL